MKCEIDISAIKLLEIVKNHMKFFSDSWLDNLREEIQKELDSREFEGREDVNNHWIHSSPYSN